jgi:hypothetical protein
MRFIRSMMLTLRSNNDKNILYHAAPVTGQCYDFDDKTGAWFSNAGGRWYTAGESLSYYTIVAFFFRLLIVLSSVYTEKGCSGDKQGICSTGNCDGTPLPDAKCHDKGNYRSYKAA